MKIHIIDGYNAIHSLQSLSRFLLKEEGLKLAREDLVRKCAEKFKSSFIVVFDGKLGRKGTDTPNTIFTSEGVSADEVILDLVSQYRSKNFIVYVYTRDRSLQEKAKQRGAISMDPNEICREIRKSSKNFENFETKSKKLRYYNWEKEFGITQD
ncbi:MAG: NYN domain-containing protein [bacterium]|nr:NYN domain-containing protein [bacterium]